jgi:predicted DNA-binding transcriptional regulator AlpA
MIADDFVSAPSDLIDPAASASAVNADSSIEPDPAEEEGVDPDLHELLGRSPANLSAAEKEKIRNAERQRKNRIVPSSPARTFTLKEVCALLRVGQQWFWNHRGDPDLPRPLRLGAADNPRAPLRFLECDLVEYLRKLQARTNATRPANQQGWGVRDKRDAQ